MGLSLAVFHCDIIDWRLGTGAETVSTPTHDPRGGLGWEQIQKTTVTTTTHLEYLTCLLQTRMLLITGDLRVIMFNTESKMEPREQITNT